MRRGRLHESNPGAQTALSTISQHPQVSLAEITPSKVATRRKLQFWIVYV